MDTSHLQKDLKTLLNLNYRDNESFNTRCWEMTLYLIYVASWTFYPHLVR